MGRKRSGTYLKKAWRPPQIINRQEKPELYQHGGLYQLKSSISLQLLFIHGNCWSFLR